MGHCIDKILTDPVLLFLRLAHINDLVTFVAHNIHAGGKRECGRLVLQFIKSHNSPNNRLNADTKTCIEAVVLQNINKHPAGAVLPERLLLPQRQDP